MQFLKILDLGLNIQNEEITKKNNEIPKIVLSTESLCLESDLCKSVIFFKKKGSSFLVYFASPVFEL